jgi:hypothetical protein
LSVINEDESLLTGSGTFCNIYRHFISAGLGLIFAKNYYTLQQHASRNTYYLWHKRPADIEGLKACDHSVIKFINGLLFMFVRYVHFKLTTHVLTFAITVLLLASIIFINCIYFFYCYQICLDDLVVLNFILDYG